MRTAFDPDELAALEDERDFLLRSLDDLERERAEGNLEVDDYRRLGDDYTARAAAVIRSIEGGQEREEGKEGEVPLDARPVAPLVPARARVVAVAAIVAFAVVAAVLLARSLGERLPGETVTGNEQLRRDVTGLVASADALLQRGEAADALRRYDEAAKLDPGAAEPRAKSAFIVFNAGLVEEALSRLDEAEAADASYPDSYFFRGIVLFRGRGDVEGARTAFARYLELAPGGPYAEDARVVLDELDRSATDEEPTP